MFYWMPDSPAEARFLRGNDKVLAVSRLRHNQTGVMSREWRYAQFVDTLTDVKTWLWFAMMFCISAPSNGISIFGPLIIQSFVSDPFHTMLFNVPIGISHIIAVSTSAYLSMKWKLKGPVIIMLCVPPLVGLSLLLYFPHDDAHRVALLASYFCLSTFTGISEFRIRLNRFRIQTKCPSASHLRLVISKHCGRYQAQDHLSSRLHRGFRRQRRRSSLVPAGRCAGLLQRNPHQRSVLCGNNLIVNFDYDLPKSYEPQAERT